MLWGRAIGGETFRRFLPHTPFSNVPAECCAWTSSRFILRRLLVVRNPGRFQSLQALLNFPRAEVAQ